MSTNQPMQPPKPDELPAAGKTTGNVAQTPTETATPPETVPQPPTFDYSDKQLRLLEKAISTERLTPYYARSRGDQWVAIRLYERNTKLSEALYGVLQGLEVLLRNSIHNKLSKDIGAEDWYEQVPFFESERDEIEKAKKTISDRPAPITPGRVVAELNFGFWVRMFSGQYEKQFWVKHLHSIYAMSMQRTVLHDRLTQIKTLRNRIAHHETLIKRDVSKDYADILEAIRWISPNTRAWVESTNSFETRFAERIPKKPKAAAATSADTVPGAPPGQ